MYLTTQNMKNLKINWWTPLLFVLIYVGVSSVQSLLVLLVDKILSSEQVLFYSLDMSSFLGKIDLLIALLIIHKFIIPFDVNLFSLKLKIKELLLSVLLAGILVSITLLIVYYLFEMPKENFYINNYTRVIDLIGLCLLAPILEELFYRGVLFKTLSTRYSFILSALYSSLIFSLMHMSLRNLLPTFITGFAMCCVLKKTNNIVYCIIIHMIINILITYITY